MEISKSSITAEDLINDDKNVRVNLNKGKFFRKEVAFLAHVISTKGTKTNKEKIKMIQEFRKTKNKRKLQSFLKLLNFYNRYVEKSPHGRAVNRVNEKR